MAAKGSIELQDLNGNPITPDKIQGGDTIIAIVTPPDGYEFNRWVDNVGNTITAGIEILNDGMFKITVSCGILYKAIFKKVGDDTCSVEWAVKLNNGVGNPDYCYDCGIVDVSDYYCNGQATVEYDETSNCCYEFEKWEDGAGTIPNPRTVGVTIGSHIQYTAIVRQKIYRITVEANNPLLGTLYIGPKDGSYMQTEPYDAKCGEKFMLLAKPKDGCTFAGWPDLDPSNSNYKTNPRVVTFDCSMEGGKFDISPLTEYSAIFQETPKYTIRYHSNTGSGDTTSNDPQYYSEGDTFTTKASDTFSYAYHTFIGWKFDSQSSATYGGGEDVILTSGIVALADSNNIIHLYAQWSEAQKNSIKYDINGGEGETPEPEEAYIGSDIVLHDGSGIYKGDDKLIGWNTQPDGSGTTYGLGSNYTMTAEEVVMYAFWSSLYIVKYDPNGADGSILIDNNNGACYTFGDTTTVYSNAETGYVWSHHTFVNWNTLSDGSGTTYVAGAPLTITDDVILYAQWSEDESSSLKLWDADGITTYQTYTRYVGDRITLDYVPTLSHYVFQGWATEIGGNVVYSIGDTYTLVSGGSDLYAVWATAPTYTVTYNGNGSTSGSVVDSNEYYSGESATVLGQGNLVKSGSPYNCVFEGWYTNSQGTGTKYVANDTITVTNDITLYAKWACCPITFSVNPSVNGKLDVNGAQVTSPTTFNYEDATQIDVTVLPKTGCAFLGWINNATGLYIVPEDDNSCAVTIPDSTRYAYVPITPATTPSSYTTTSITTPTYATLSDYTNRTIVYNQTTGQYYQCIDLSLIACPVEMSCGGTYIASFSTCNYGELVLCSDCDNGYEYVESDPIYFYNEIVERITGLTPVDWRGSASSWPVTATANTPMYLEYNDNYYKKTKSGSTYSYVASTQDEYNAPAQPQAADASPMYIYDDSVNKEYYKIEYDGDNVTNVTKAYDTLPTDYLGDAISWYDNTATMNEYYDSTYYSSNYNLYYEWDATNNGYSLIPSSHSYSVSTSDESTIPTIFFQTQYQNYTFIIINSSTYKWNNSTHLYGVTSETPVTPYTFNNVMSFITAYKRYDAYNNPITAFFLQNTDTQNSSIQLYKWKTSGYAVTPVIPVFRNDSWFDSNERLVELQSLFPVDIYGIRINTSNASGSMFRFGDILNFNNEAYVWDSVNKRYNASSGITLANADAHVYSFIPSIGTSDVPNTFIGTYIIYDGVLMKLRYCYSATCNVDENMYYEPTGYTIGYNNVIGTTGTSVDGLYVTARTQDSEGVPLAITATPSNFMDNTYGTPSYSDPDYVMVESTYYLGMKTGTSVVYDEEFPCYHEESTYNNFNNIPSWRARAGLTDGNPTENMYIFPNTLVENYFMKQMGFKLYKKVCQTS